MENKKNRIRYTVEKVLSNSFYQMPKFLFEGEFKKLSNDARVLYMLLKDRHELSVKNEWYNEKNEVYLIMRREEMETLLNLSAPTIRKALKELKELNLIDEERQGLNKPNILFLMECKNLSVQSEKKLQSKEKKNYSQKRKDFSANHINRNQTNLNDTDVSIKSGEAKSETFDNNSTFAKTDTDSIDTNTVIKNYSPEEVADKISLEQLKSKYEDRHEEINMLYDIICEVLTDNPKPTFRVSRQNIPLITIKPVFADLQREHLEYVLRSLNNNDNKYKINKNAHNYLRTSLFHAPRTITYYHDRTFKKPEQPKDKYTELFELKLQRQREQLINEREEELFDNFSDNADYNF
jgi:DNA-binding transcriptional ArsR family regulator